MTPDAQRALEAALDAIAGKSWGRRFERIVAELSTSDCSELIRVLVAAGEGDQGAFRELREAAGAGNGPALLDLVTAFAPASYDPN